MAWYSTFKKALVLNDFIVVDFVATMAQETKTKTKTRLFFWKFTDRQTFRIMVIDSKAVGRNCDIVG